MAIINNLSDLIFNLLRAVGIIAIAFGVCTLGFSFFSHDHSQRPTAIWAIVGGLLIALAREIIGLILP